ncbi:hypothetical protein [Zavarzinia sp.]|jgi:hypothetical protein|uniref:hypothetical protein n=1 Tax=Zavarzinia sp. TaxID=2027920 RepID=UPI003564ECBB
MARGLAIPIRTVQGRVVTVDGADQMDLLVQLILADGENANPFNTDVGTAAGVFDLQDAAQRAILDRRVRQHFDRLYADGRAELLDLSVRSDDDAGETTVQILYRDLETDEQRPLSVKIGNK